MGFITITGLFRSRPERGWIFCGAQAGAIYRRAGNGWRRMLGAARDIGVGANGAVWVIGTDSGTYRWNGRGWPTVPGAAVGISVGRAGKPWVVTAGRVIFRGSRVR